MKNAVLAILIILLTSTKCFAVCDTFINGNEHCDFDVNDHNTISPAPDISNSGEARIYFDGSKLKCSEDGGAYTDCVGGSGNAPDSATYVTTSTDATLTAEKILTEGTAIDVTVAGGDGGTATVAFDSTEVGTTTFGSGSAITWTFDSGSNDQTLLFGTSNFDFTVAAGGGPFRIIKNPSSGSSIDELLQFRKTTSGTAINGMGLSIGFNLENSDGTTRETGKIEHVAVDADATPTGGFNFYATDNSTSLTKVLVITGSQVRYPGGLQVIGADTDPDEILDIVASTTTNGQIRMQGGVAPSSDFNDGALWYQADVDNVFLRTGANGAEGMSMAFPRVQFTQATNVTVSNTATETTLIGTVVPSANATIQSSTFNHVGKTLHIKARGHYGTDAATPGNLNMRIKFGSTELIATGDVGATANVTDEAWDIDALCTVQSVGATGVVQCSGSFDHGNDSATHDTSSWEMLDTDGDTVDLTADQAFSITADWDTADAQNTITATNISVTWLN